MDVTQLSDTDLKKCHAEYVRRRRTLAPKSEPFVRGALMPEAKERLEEEALAKMLAPKEKRLAEARALLAGSREPHWTAGPGSNGEIELPPLRVCGNGKLRCGAKVSRELQGVPFCEAHYRLQEGADFD